MNIEFANHQFELHPEGAMYWPRHQALLVSDIHLGKAATFQRHGIPIPNELDDENLEKLQDLITKTKARKLIIAGDLIHAPFKDIGHQTNILARLKAFHLDRITLIIGNHDKASLDKKRIEEVDELHLDGIKMIHEPCFNDLSPPNISGHLHPQIKIRSGRAVMRCKCFVIQKQQLILPAFGAFTGGFQVEKKQMDSIFIIAGNKVYPLE